MSKNKNRKSLKNEVVISEKSNGLTEFALNMQTQQNQVAQGKTVELNLRRYLLSNNRDLLGQMYVEIGIVQTLIDQPVDDAYAEIPQIISSQLSEDDCKEVIQYIQENNWFEKFKQALKWGRLFGGAGLFINVNQNPESELRLDLIKQGDKVDLYPCDRWELNFQARGDINAQNLNDPQGNSKTPYNLYGEAIHYSRVLKIKGKEAPSLNRLQLMGWGMSEVERLIRSLNGYLKNQDLIFELLDEAKLDVYKIDGFNDALGQTGGTDKITKQIALSNSVKSYLNALVLDKEDEYDQKQMSFSGLPEMNKQNKENIASDLRMPITKLFGISSAGFNSGEDDIENYNSMLKSEIRAKSRTYLIMVYKLACAVVLGFIPDDLDIELPDLRILSAEQQENVKNNQFNRLMAAFQNQLITEEEFKTACNKNSLLPIQIDAKAETVMDKKDTTIDPTNNKKKEKSNSLLGWFQR